MWIFFKYTEKLIWKLPLFLRVLRLAFICFTFVFRIPFFLSNLFRSFVPIDNSSASYNSISSWYFPWSDGTLFCSKLSAVDDTEVVAITICDLSTADDMPWLHGYFCWKLARKCWSMGIWRVQIMFLPLPSVSLCDGDGAQDTFGLAWTATYCCVCLVTDPVMHKIWSIEWHEAAVGVVDCASGITVFPCKLRPLMSEYLKIQYFGQCKENYKIKSMNGLEILLSKLFSYLTLRMIIVAVEAEMGLLDFHYLVVQ